MDKLLATFLRTYNFRRQLSITVTLGILLLALFSSLVGSWQSNVRARANILNQSQSITENLAQQSTLALVYASSDNAINAVNAAMSFPGVIRVEIRDVARHILLERGEALSDGFPVLTVPAGKTGPPDGTNTAAVLEAENQKAWRFVAPVYSQPSTDSPLIAQASSRELLGHVVVVVSKAALTQATTGLFVANLATSFSFAFFFLLLIRALTNRMTQPLNQLSDSMRRAEAGEQQVRAISAGPKDIADMAHAFNSMMSVLEEREAALRIAAIAFESQEGMMITDSNRIILRVNHAFTHITGYTAEEAIGKSVGMRSSGRHDGNFYAAMWKSINDTGAWEGEILNRRKNGEIYPEYLAVTVVKDMNGATTNYVATFSDITERKKAEAAFASNRAKSEFLANMSHEIRTPLNGIIGMLDILQQTGLEPKQSHMVNTVQDSSLALLNILNDILDFSKIEAGKLEVERIPSLLREIVEDAAQLMHTTAEAKSIDLYVYVSPQIPLWIATDPLRLRQVLLNLLGNALKFTFTEDGRCGQVQLRVEYAMLSNGRPEIRLRVIDNGIGMSRETQAKLFQPFTQADESTSRKFGGTGLGLSITLRLIELMGGRISVHSTLGVGSEFTVNLPLEEAVPGQQPVALPDLAGVRILAVTGSAICAEILKAYCDTAGASIAIFAGLDAACLRARQMQSSPDEITLLLDVDVTIENESGIPDFVQIVRLVRRSRGASSAGAVVVNAHPLLYRELIEGIAIACGRMKASNSIRLSERRLHPRSSAPTVEEAMAANRLILLAEDNETNREVIREQLRLLGYAAEVARDGVTALNMWRTGRYAMLLTDCHMPNMDGFELTAAIRAEEPQGSRLPIIAITANALRGEAERCIEHGMSDYLSKPLRLNEFDTMLTKWLPLPEAAPKPVAADRHKEPDGAAIADFPVWDAMALARMVGNNPGMHRRLLEKFLANAQKQVAEMLSAIAAGDVVAVCEMAHTFKSAARMVGAMQLGELCQEIEIAGRGGEAQNYSALAVNLSAAFEAAAEKIKQAL